MSITARSEEHTSELQSRLHLVCRLLLEKKKSSTSNLDLRDTKGQQRKLFNRQLSCYFLFDASLLVAHVRSRLFFFFNDTATTEIYTLSLHDALPIRTSAARGLGRPPAERSRANQRH